MESFEYNAPTFINFLEKQLIEENDGADTFFDCHVGDTPKPAKRSDFRFKEDLDGDPLQTTQLSHTPERERQIGATSHTATSTKSCTSEGDSSCVSNETYTISPAKDGLERLKELDNIEEEDEIQDLISDVQELTVKTPAKHNTENVKKDRIVKTHVMSLRSDATVQYLSSKDDKTIADNPSDRTNSERKQKIVPSEASKDIKAATCNPSDRTNVERKQKIIASEGKADRGKRLTFTYPSQMEKRLTNNNLEVSKRKGSPLACAYNKRFISMAEAVIRFQQCTPERFHTEPYLKASLARKFMKKKAFSPLSGTIPQSPHLLTKERGRPLYCLSRKAEEEKEIEEIKSFQLKARPIDKKALEGWVPPLIERKAPTVPHPFHLTELKKKENKPPEIFSFTAKPAPKKILQRPQGVPEKKILPVTQPVTPNVARKVKHMIAAKIVQDENDDLQIINKEVPHEGVPVYHQKHATEVRPFTFEERDREIQRRKEERLQKIFEEEKKAREFKAKPLPSFIKSPGRNSSIMSLTRKKPDPKDEEGHHTVFKARPATVLHKKPFVPEKVVHPLTDTTDIVLNTERRIKERENFEKQLKEREAIIEEYKRREAERIYQEEEEARAMLRKMAVHKANPIRKYKPVEPSSSEKLLTDPMSPAFHIRKKEKQNE